MTKPTLKPSKEFIAQLKKELLAHKAKVEAKPSQEIQVQPLPQLQPKPEPKKTADNQKIHERAPSPVAQIAFAAMMPRPTPQSTVNTYTAGDYLITQKKTFA